MKLTTDQALAEIRSIAQDVDDSEYRELSTDSLSFALHRITVVLNLVPE